MPPPRAPWWQRFGDPQLDALEQQALAGNPTLAAASARLAQARALVASASASLFPQVGLGARAARQKISANRPLTNYSSPNFSTVQNDFVGLARRELRGRSLRPRAAHDRGRARRRPSSRPPISRTRGCCSPPTSPTAYFNLREIDIELDVLARSIELQRRALELATARHDLGAASGPRRRAAAGAARQHADAGRRAAPARAASSSTRSPR